MLPKEFETRMEMLLKEKYPLLKDELENKDPSRAFRINTIKATPSLLNGKALFKATPIPFAENGYYFSEDKIGNHPYHHAGAIYVQDPSAMATVNALEIEKGWRILDMCSAPGGKTTQLAEKIGADGLLFSNEYVPSRCKLMVGNLERLGTTNTVAINTDAKTLSEWFSSCFDLVLADVPCSGEGMFRKNEQAVKMWSKENVIACAKRQKEIIEYGAKTVKTGGYLLYSTCTFSLEENEMQIDEFLSTHPEFSLVPVGEALKNHTEDGFTFEGAKSKELHLCRRFYPHVSKGEGQFIALLRKNEGDEGAYLYKDASTPLSRAEAEIVNDFLSKNLLEYKDLCIRKYNNNIIALKKDAPIPPKSVFCAGVLLGSINKNLFTPHHHLFSALGDRFIRKIDLSLDDARVYSYMHGDVIPVEKENGFACVQVDGISLGGAKIVDGMAKNHYPKGLRIN
jgi:NOL1/NOP2/sun family putative RNA methylase